MQHELTLRPAGSCVSGALLTLKAELNDARVARDMSWLAPCHHASNLNGVDGYKDALQQHLFGAEVCCYSHDVTLRLRV